MTIKDEVKNKEIVELLRKLIAGSVDISRVDPRFGWENGNGDIQFYIGGFLVSLFNDAGDLDYIDYVKAPDGREGDYESWDSDYDPIEVLSGDEIRSLKAILDSAT